MFKWFYNPNVGHPQYVIVVAGQYSNCRILYYFEILIRKSRAKQRQGSQQVDNFVMRLMQQPGHNWNGKVQLICEEIRGAKGGNISIVDVK